MKPMPANFFQLPSGKQPVRDFLLKLSKTERKIIGEDIRATQLGWPLGLPLVGSLSDGLWEIRSALPDKIVRTFFIVHHQSLVLLHAIVKKSQKAPSNDITIARKRGKQVTLENTKGKK